ncbi:MAG: NUDIX hydrolase [Candidatus Pacebacteria bacterium]|jgi:8-oxo-dGTP pyrophosphatase MutT (NUDIX family)|nr:NUDIX hydrolase [Candidatus Paceibacterota bacterium]MBT4652355.1 NUDIX hydrolase [Candidatus Paceibacterota bacterium]MBT6756182.1 NUDIX hydrolase [Candidatus Paceibacterota bacterium]MBT6921473.1 NUDIX hydrolase [Candidatus Paceibacterota bacterium]
MNSKKIKIKIEKPFGNLFRKATILVACQTPEKTYLFGEKKDFYPEGIVRLIGGGVEKGDSSPKEAAILELKEEINYKPKLQELKSLGAISITATDNKNKKYNHIIHIYFLQIPPKVNLKAQDDLTGIVELNTKQFEKLIKRYYSLSKKNIRKKGNLEFSWYDYAQVYGPVHQFVFDLLENNIS